MALGDYILCSQCDCKLVYDGNREHRDWLEERFKTRSLICPTCAAEQKRRADLCSELVEALEKLTDGLRRTTWSTWQSTDRFWGKYEEASAVLAKCKEPS